MAPSGRVVAALFTAAMAAAMPLRATSTVDYRLVTPHLNIEGMDHLGTGSWQDWDRGWIEMDTAARLLESRIAKLKGKGALAREFKLKWSTGHGRLGTVEALSLPVENQNVKFAIAEGPLFESDQFQPSFSPDGNLLAALTWNAKGFGVEVTDVSSRHVEAFKTGSSPALALQFSPDGSRLIWTGDKGLAEVEFGQGPGIVMRLRDRFPSTTDYIENSAFSPDGRQLYFTRWDFGNDVKKEWLCDVSEFKPSCRILPRNDQRTGPAWSSELKSAIPDLRAWKKFRGVNAEQSHHSKNNTSFVVEAYSRNLNNRTGAVETSQWLIYFSDKAAAPKTLHLGRSLTVFGWSKDGARFLAGAVDSKNEPVFSCWRDGYRTKLEGKGRWACAAASSVPQMWYQVESDVGLLPRAKKIAVLSRESEAWIAEWVDASAPYLWKSGQEISWILVKNKAEWQRLQSLLKDPDLQDFAFSPKDPIIARVLAKGRGLRRVEIAQW